MNKIIIIIPVLLFMSVAEAGNRLNVIFFERDPWLMVIGSDSPIFVNYLNGLTIYQANIENNKKEYFTVMLNKEENSALMEKILSLNGLNKKYSVSEYSDQPIVEIHYYDEKTVKKTKSLTRKILYGNLKNSTKDREKSPKEFVNLYDYLTQFTHKNAVVWTPKFIEIMVWPYEYAPEESIVWPEDWPDLNSKYTVKRREDSYSIYLPYSKKQEFEEFIKTRNEKGAVEINDRKWAVSTRIPFPFEIAHNQTLNQDAQ